MISIRALSAATTLSFGLAIAGMATPAAADTLVDNVQGITIGKDGEVERFTGLWIDDDGRIRQVLRRNDDRPAKPDFALDGKGKYLVPGMIDSHLHVMDLGIAAMTLDLSGSTSLDDALSMISAYAAQNPSLPWIIGRGWNQEVWGLGRFPTAADLDAVVADRPVFLERADNHAHWANSNAIERAGITAKTADPDGGRIIRVAGSRKPAGVFVDNASNLIRAVVPELRAADRDVAFAKAQERLLSMGVTAVADMGTDIEDWQTFRRAGDLGRLKIRIMSYAKGVDQMALIGGPGPGPWLYDDRLRLNGVKLSIDGALGSRGAWLKQPYSDDAGNTGLPMIDPTKLRNLMSRAALERFQIAVHAIGDAANADLLYAIEELAPTYTGDRRWRVEHAQILDPADLGQFGRHGIIASMQPVHQTSDRLMAEARLGTARLDAAYAWRSIAATGAKLAFGSDAPVESPEPFAGLAVAISRTDSDGEPFGGWYPSQTVSREAALAAFTSDGAYAGFADGRFGRLVRGERADFLLLDRDPLLANARDLRETKLFETWVNGERLYEAP
ncbi:putative amidohydrolase YtcJ [Alteripontixanthobacter maritimus]|uniref:Putative amidohydrolase YtcJ n=1 Tax=Alteripontixanthobacter maritimus TaxID=2161824 RepID=A0A369Q6Z1_9SPHN|nr:amidohydrolase [Alteripontixanthobacter maritimus]RDC59315.1 putative amidohydrolase YtcJ [Alteripontixanthobacter maritimus]